MKTCENCGCKVYRLGCENCNEESYIYEQYVDLDIEPIPKSISDKYNEQQNEKTKDLHDKTWRPM